jgi:hypothetical protein
MTQDEIIRMARETGAYKNCDVWQMNAELLERFAALVAEATKEKAAQVCDRGAERMTHAYKRDGAARCAAAIRSMK